MRNRFPKLTSLRYLRVFIGMITRIFTAALFFLAGQALATNEIIVNGLYHGKNLLIQNPLSRNSQGYCIQEIYVNDHLVLQNIKISAVEIELGQFELYDRLTIRITHREGCEPYLLNPEAIVFKREFTYHSIRINADSLL